MNSIGKGFLFLLAICIGIRLFVGEPCYVPSESMGPTLRSGDWIWLDKVSYGALLPNRFADIPLLNAFTWITPLRVMDERIHWKSRRMAGFCKPQVHDVIVFRHPQNRNMLLVKRIVSVSERNGCLSYYVMGDNRENSIDSRVWGEIPDTVIVGKVNRILFSVKDWKRILKKVE